MSGLTQIAAVTGHKTLPEVQIYIEAADRNGTSDDAFDVMVARSNGEQTLANMVTSFARF